MRRRLSGWLFGAVVVLRMTLSPAYASLLGSVFDAVHRMRDALPVRVELGPAGIRTAAQRDSVRRVQLARLATLGDARPPAWSEDFAVLPRGVRLSFRIADTVSRDVTVKLRAPSGEWKALARVRADKLGRATWRDSTTRFARTLEVALALRTAHGTPLVPMPPVRLVPTGLSLESRVDGDGGATLALRLPTGYPATLEVFDVSGRAVGTIDVPRFAAGEYRVPVPRAMIAQRGVYFARLSQRGECATTKLVVCR